jgi:HK97 gp10 family phage protein
LAKARVTGTGKLIKQLQEFSSEGAKRAAAEVEATARDISAKAKQNAPANFGKLKQGIEPEKINPLTWEVIANTPYAGFVEFGTRSKVQVPAEMQEVANAIKSNPKGSFEDGLRSIQDWCRAKGIDERAAYPIFISILEEGIEPRPFMFPAWKQGGQKLEANLKKTLEVLTKRFNAQK